jgi:hypothetical protein
MAIPSGLENWIYNPIQEIRREDNKSHIHDFTASLGLKYKIFNSLNLELRYQFENSTNNQEDAHNDSSYYVRDLINKYTQVDPVLGTLSYPIPPGGILDRNASEILSHQGRAQLNFRNGWGDNHQLTAIAGWEVRSLTTTANASRSFGFRPEISSINSNVDFVTAFPQYQYGVLAPYVTVQIPNIDDISSLTDHFLSYYANAAYTFKNRYVISASARDDQANLFGVKANEKGKPLWSAGVSWEISKEPFFHIGWVPFLKFRATFGSNGNISRLTSAYTTTLFSNAFYTSSIRARIINPPNNNLHWEQISMLNLAVEFETLHKRISGKIEYYLKKGTGLMGQSPVDPSLGLSDQGGRNFFYGNVAGMKGKGTDIELRSTNFAGTFTWLTDLIFSYAGSKVTQYLMPVSATGHTYLAVASNNINPVIGKPLYALYSYRWAGLDPATGDPTGYLNSKPSTDYVGISANTPLDSMKYNGSAQPLYFGAFRNTFNWHHISVSVNISYKGGYYLRRSSINYGSLYSSWTGDRDYALRWQKSGDEKKTIVPSRVYPINSARDDFFTNSEVLVEKGDNIRLEDVTLSYDLDRAQWSKLPFRNVRINLYASNLGIIWTANKLHLDPYAINVPGNGKVISLGLNINF